MVRTVPDVILSSCGNCPRCTIGKGVMKGRNNRNGVYREKRVCNHCRAIYHADRTAVETATGQRDAWRVVRIVLPVEVPDEPATP